MAYRPGSRLQLIYLLHFISGDSENTTRLKDICENEFNSSKWLNNRCYYFHNKDEISFDNATKICSEIFKEIGFGKGRLYEPENLEDFAKIYELAEQFEKLLLPETEKPLQLWLGLNDRSKEGDFVYNSNGKLPKFNAPWHGNQ